MLDFVLDIAGDPSFGLPKRSGWIVDPAPTPGRFGLIILQEVTFLLFTLAHFLFCRPDSVTFRVPTQLPLGVAA